jgi:hypothetical protein
MSVDHRVRNDGPEFINNLGSGPDASGPAFGNIWIANRPGRVSRPGRGSIPVWNGPVPN